MLSRFDGASAASERVSVVLRLPPKLSGIAKQTQRNFVLAFRIVRILAVTHTARSNALHLATFRNRDKSRLDSPPGLLQPVILGGSVGATRAALSMRSAPHRYGSFPPIPATSSDLERL